MSSLLPNHHRSTSDRLLNNYLSSQKQLTTALLTLLSHSHSSTSSLLAYVTSSSGVAYPVRRAVQNAAFEGPMDTDTGTDYGSITNGGATEAKWHEYISSLEHFRKELKEVHSLEEELSQVKKDREILVSRLIKATKSRPTKADIAAAAKASHNGSESGRTRHSNASVLSFGSDHSGTTTGGGRSKRQEKLAEAQAEVLGCEEHLRGLEVRLEEERNKVMRHGLMERFRAMEDVGRMWQRQARLGLAELERAHGHEGPMLHPNAYEVESNGSIAPSQSASQVGYGSDGEAERHRSSSRNNGRAGHHVPGMPGSVAGSIAEEDENSSSDDDGNFVVHENKKPGLAPMGGDARSRSQTTIVPQDGRDAPGLPSITTIGANRPQGRRQHSGSSGSSAPRGPGRRTQSELGYNPPRARQNRMSLRRSNSGRAQSDASSVHSVGQGKKKGGFFKSIAKLFKSNKSSGSVAGSTRGGGRGGADSPPLTSRNRNGWSTRTDANIKRVSSSAGTARGGSSGRRTRNADYSSSDDEMGGGGFVAVSNRGNNTWSVDNVGKVPAPAASAAKPKKTRSDLGAGIKGRTNSQSTITPVAGKITSKPPGVSGIKSSSSATGASSKRTRHGSITRVGARGSTMGAPPSIAGVLEGSVAKRPSSALGKSPSTPASSPPMMDIPKAPKSQVTPQMYQATAPPPTKAPLLQPPPAKISTSASTPVGLGDGYVPKASASAISKSTITPKSQSHSQNLSTLAKRESTVTKRDSALADLNLGAPIGMTQANPSVDSITARASTPLPPSKTLSPPAKSAMRSASPMPPSSPVHEAPPPAFIISAPKSVIEEKPVIQAEPVKVQEEVKPVVQAERPSTPATMTDADSVYESAVEEDKTDDERRVVKSTAGTNQVNNDDDDASSVASDSTAGPGYKVVENTEGPAARLRQAGNATSNPAETNGKSSAVPITGRDLAPANPKGTVEEDQYVAAPPASVTASTIERRKSVRMAVPPSPGTPTANQSNPINDTTSRPSVNVSSGWNSRVGRSQDSSEDEDNAAYAKARRNLNRYSSLSASNSTSNPSKKKKKSTKA